jgi:membrane protease YdiL (CAAX protease family)
MGFGLGFSGPVAAALADQLGLGRTGRHAITAVLVSVIVVTLVALLCRIDWRPLKALGFGPAASSVRAFVVGVLVTGGCAAAVIVPAMLGGWIAVGPADWPALILFLILNALIAFGLEAFPEELVFRGYVHSTLARRGRKAAFISTTALFACIMVPTSAVTAGTVLLLGGEPAGLLLAPGGQDPATYLVLMVCFGATLLTARIATGSLWTPIGLHLTFLTVNRLVFANADRDTGWRVEAAPDAAILVLAYLALTAAVFAIVTLWQRGRFGSRATPDGRPSGRAAKAAAPSGTDHVGT